MKTTSWRGCGVAATTSLLFGLGLGVGGCAPTDDAAEAGSKPKAERRLSRVETMTVEAVPFQAHTTLIGQTEADQRITVAAEAPGRILATNYEEGAQVDKGQWLARVDANVDRTRLGQLRTNLEQARRDLERLRALKARGLATDAQIEQAQLGVENANYNIKLTRAGLGKSGVVAPIGGIVDKVFAKRGEYAQPGAPLVTIVDYSTIVVEAGLPESSLPYAEVGKPVQVKIAALNLTVDARIRRLGVEANTRNRTFPLYVEVDNADGRIRPGMRAEVLLPTVQLQAGLLIPRNAVVESLEGRSVFVLGQGDVVARREVTLGPGRAEYVVVNSGVSVGDAVVTVGQRLLSEGEQVKVLSTTPCCASQLRELDGGEAPNGAKAMRPQDKDADEATQREARP